MAYPLGLRTGEHPRVRAGTRVGFGFAVRSYASGRGQMDDRTDDGKQTEDALAECEERVEELEEENADLRNAAQTFGDLAERLNTKQRLDND
jgi:predicted RNase H-like nuclease (RuvC/YqgF family)